MPARNRRVDQALQTPKYGIWIVTAAILLAGLAAILLITAPGERQRRELVEGLRVGDPAERVTELLGEPPARCDAASLEHLRPAFPAGRTPAGIDVALQHLSRATRERWVYPVREGDPAPCTPAEGRTEVGMDRDGRVLWFQPVTGRTAFVLPPSLTPAGPEPDAGEP